jgi:hypothetical protein
MYNPDKWLIVKINSDTPHYRVFGSWGGGYTHGDSWRMNSGIKKVTIDGDYYLFEGSSGSVYKCHKQMYGSTGYGWSVISNMKEQQPMIEILDESVDVTKLEYK